MNRMKRKNSIELLSLNPLLALRASIFLLP